MIKKRRFFYMICKQFIEDTCSSINGEFLKIPGKYLWSINSGYLQLLKYTKGSEINSNSIKWIFIEFLEHFFQNF